MNLYSNSLINLALAFSLWLGFIFSCGSIQPVEDKGDRNANTGDGRFLMEQRPMDDVASQLTNVLGQPVRNETKLRGVYTFSLAYSPDRGLVASNADP